MGRSRERRNCERYQGKRVADPSNCNRFNILRSSLSLSLSLSALVPAINTKLMKWFHAIIKKKEKKRNSRKKHSLASPRLAFTHLALHLTHIALSYSLQYMNHSNLPHWHAHAVKKGGDVNLTMPSSSHWRHPDAARHHL